MDARAVLAEFDKCHHQGSISVNQRNIVSLTAQKSYHAGWAPLCSPVVFLLRHMSSAELTSVWLRRGLLTRRAALWWTICRQSLERQGLGMALSSPTYACSTNPSALISAFGEWKWWLIETRNGYKPIIPALRWLRQETCQFKANPSYLARSCISNNKLYLVP